VTNCTLAQASNRKRLLFLYFDAGGGHRSAATALKAVIDEQKRPWDVRLVNLQEILDPLDIFRKYTRIRMQDVYNLLLKKGWTLGSPTLVVAMHALIRLYHGGQVRLLKQYWAESRPDLVVSLIPNFNRALYDSLNGTPLATVLTDLADYPPHFWIERQNQYFVCGTAKAVEQARAMGHAPERIFRASGMILRPGFYGPVETNRHQERRKLGLDPDLPTGLVLFGGEGSEWMIEIARSVAKSGLKLQLICICGKNGGLRARLERLKPNFPLFVEGFTSEIPYYMHLADFFIGKAGPGSISEALAMKLPVIVERNAWTLAQERYNTDWIREKEVGVVLPSFREIEKGLHELLEPSRFQRFRENAAAIENRAVFEIPEFLDQILQRETR
jgi:UDP-N-acetylglucosamine:LPS N-acetylglucosamine transferase